MHPALQISEVIYTISSCAHQGSLPGLASTCRAFERPALDALWRDLQSVEPLVICLPSDLFSYGRRVGVPDVINCGLQTEFTCTGIAETS
jgi:hypothetical protein